MKKLLVMLFVLVGSSLTTLQAHAAQAGKIIVDSAVVHEYPQKDSGAIEQLPKDEMVTVSNLPTEGFYKVRTRSGNVGWVSGNDVLVGSVNPGPETSGAPSSRYTPRAPRAVESDDGGYGGSKEASMNEDDSSSNLRLLFMLGMSSLSYGDLLTKFGLVSKDLNYGLTGMGEGQFRMSDSVSWAIRIEFYSTTAPAKAVTTTTGLASSQTLSSVTVPLELGLMWSPIHERSRLGFGAYAGGTITSSTTVTQTNYAQVQYTTFAPVASVLMQGVIALNETFGIASEVGYRYQLPNTTATSTYYGTGFKIDYSGVFGRLGIEMKL